jgi:hypothetical protein
MLLRGDACHRLPQVTHENIFDKPGSIALIALWLPARMTDRTGVTHFIGRNITRLFFNT